MLVKITQADIDAGVKGNCFKCPAALAIDRKLPEGIYCTVTFTDVGLYGKINAIRSLIKHITLPEKIQWWIINFDHPMGIKSQPIEFDLPVEEAIEAWKKRNYVSL